ncbi:MAG: polyhydroxyalkanoic acid system family protein [Polaromonas sp.]|nr:polyhydroxyalkanoic acid system family protein [Polaromonas sp.]
MADIHIERPHGMGLVQARQAAQAWAEKAEKKYDLRCTYQQGETADALSFTRSGVSGTLRVTGERFDLQAKLGFLLSAFKERIEGEIGKTLDALIATQAPGPDPASESA